MQTDAPHNEPATTAIDELEAHFHTLDELFVEPGVMEKWRRVWLGLQRPADTGDHKWARLQVQRLAAPLLAVAVPLLLLLLLCLVPTERAAPVGGFMDVTRDASSLPEPLDPVAPPEPLPVPELPDVTTAGADVPAGDIGGTASDPTPLPAQAPRGPILGGSTTIRSLPRLRGPYSSRPGPDGPGPVGAGGDDAVLRALRWLKLHQEPDGCWRSGSGGGEAYGGGVPAAMTAFAVLAYLGHGETPVSAEFGGTVEQALRWLVVHQQPDGRFEGSDPHAYAQPIAAYALCEAFTMTRIPLLKDAAGRAVQVLLDGQQASGGWTYNCARPADPRNDLSYGGWCVQALKAALMAGLDRSGVDDALKRAVRGVQANASPAGGFGYTAPGEGRLTGVGVLCLQILGQGRDPTVRNGLRWLRGHAACRWEPQPGRPLYYWYYETQAFFQEGGEAWKQWDRQFAAQLCRNQQVLPDALPGPRGRAVAVGYWETIGADESYGRVYNTALCALMLEVYYRILPSYKDTQEAQDPDWHRRRDLPVTFSVGSVDA